MENNTLIPRVPTSAASDEDRVTPRVCLSDSVEGCIQAIGPCDRDLHTGSVFTVHEADIQSMDPKALICPAQLFERRLVMDALENREYWYLKPLSVKTFRMKVLDFIAVHDIAWSCVNKKQLEAITKNLGIHVQEMPADPYEAAHEIRHGLWEQGEYDLAEEFDEAVAGLPWAQCLKVESLKMERMK